MHRIGQEDQNNFLTDQIDVEVLAYFSGVRAPGGAEKRHGQRRRRVSTDTVKVRSQCSSLLAVDG